MTEPANSPDPRMKEQFAIANRPRRRRFWIVAGFAVVLALIVAPPFVNISHLRRSILRSVSIGVGRPVHASAVEFTLFPRPAFVLHNLTVDEDPDYGAEPAMMAATVRASLRASTLWHRRMEIATLRFDAPSMNLTRNAQGHWNFESLLSNSPALHSRRTADFRRARFPYIEATQARINFKFGPEKLPFSLESANLALWKDPRDQWHLRIRARPVRTDLTVEDAGQILGEAVVQAGGTLADSPLDAHLEWRRVELGGIVRLVYGEDDGWRGIVDWSGHAHGTLANLSFASDAGIEGFHRTEFVPPDDMSLSFRCQGRYALGHRSMDTLQCLAPAGNGQLLLQGRFQNMVSALRPWTGATTQRPRATGEDGVGSIGSAATPFGADDALLQIAVQHAPAAFFLDLLRHVHPGISEDATAAGLLNGELHCRWQGLETLRRCTGKIRSAAISVGLPKIDRPLKFSPVLFSSSMMETSSEPASESLSLSGGPDPGKRQLSGTWMNWNLAPVHVSLGETGSATIRGTLNSTGSTLRIDGATDLAQLAKIGSVFRVPSISGSGNVRFVRGNAQFALLLKTAWLPEAAAPVSTSTAGGPFVQFVPSSWAGTLQIRNAALRVAWLSHNLQLASAEMDFTPTSVEWTHVKGAFVHIPFDGSVRWQTPCPTSEFDCSRHFALHIPKLDVLHLQAALRPENGSAGLLDAINPWASGSPRLPRISGFVNADVLSLDRMSIKNVALRLSLQGHSADLLSISGGIFGGTLSGSGANTARDLASNKEENGNGFGTVQWGDGPLSYTLRLALHGIEPDSVAAIWRERWGHGSANAQVDLKTRGWSAAELAQRATGSFAFLWRNGAFVTGLNASSTAAATATKFQRWEAQGSIHDRKLLLGRSQIVFTPTGRLAHNAPLAQSVAGDITFGRTVNLRFQPSEMNVSGSLSDPIITGPGSVVPIKATAKTARVSAQNPGPH